jgi:hypothetical protein
MGIVGLLPFVKEAAEQMNIKEFKGSRVAVDTNVYFFKAACPVAQELALGLNTDV